MDALDWIAFSLFLFCVFSSFSIWFSKLWRRKSRLKSFGLSCLHCFMALTDTRCMLYIFSFSTRQDPCALALLGEFRTKHCMLSNHETILWYILCIYIHIQYTYPIADIHSIILIYIRMNQYDWWWSVFPLHMVWTVLQPSRLKGRWHRRSAETTRQCYRLLGIWMEWRTVTDGVECLRFAFTFYWSYSLKSSWFASRLVASPAWTRASKGYENNFKLINSYRMN